VFLPRAERVFERLAVSYVSSRPKLVDAGSWRASPSGRRPPPFSKARLTLLAFGDPLMMREQLITPKERAERSAREPKGR
jgi:hypothetical protein